MSRFSLIRTFTVIAVLAAASPLVGSAHERGDRDRDDDPRFPQVVVFGDSLSDAGNVYAATGYFSVPPFLEPIPSAPYDGGHFTNGATWVERLAREVGAPAGPALLSPSLYTNYAFGGARARASAAVASPGLGTQVGMYFGASGGTARSDALYVVFFGANDIRDAIQALPTDASLATSLGILHEAVQAIHDNIVALWAAGARTILVPNGPNLGLTPALAAQPAFVRDAAAQLSQQFNAELAAALADLDDALAGTRIVRLNVFALLNGVVQHPDVFGFTNVTQPCLHFGVVDGAICDEPRTYVFWDAIHPTTAVHRIVAQRAERALER